MKKLDDDRQIKINQILAIIKLFVLLILSVVLYTKYLNSLQLNLELYNTYYGIIPISVFILILIVVYQLWLLIFKSAMQDYNEQNIYKEIEVVIFMVIFSVLIFYFPDVYQYKLLFLFIITTSTIEFGLNYGLILSLISSVIVIGSDFFNNPGLQINETLQNDIVLVGVFILMAWLIGYYEKIEREHREKITLLAIKDGLTDLYNHRYFYDSLKQLIDSCNTSLSLLFIDIDYFKHYNDVFGHQAGDGVLKEIGEILKNTIRFGDVAARYGGEEFAIILPDTDEKGALVIAENIRKNIDQTEFNGEESQPNDSITVSIGVSCYPDRSKSAKELINSADDALYRAKFFNKNRVEIYNSILEELKNDINEVDSDLISSIKELITTINTKDKYTYGHTERVVIYSQYLAERLGLSQKDQKTLKYGAYLHDIGKINIAKEILNKRTALSDVEWNILQQHPVNGADLIKSVKGLESIIPLILHHHEKYNGTGYPDNLKGEEIPYLARILTITDSFDAMTSSRPYKPAKTFSEAITELKKFSGQQFDPVLVDEFIEIVKKVHCLRTG